MILETRNLSRYFGGLKAVDGVSLGIQEGELHAIIGPNGAGKTTLFNLLSGTLPPTNGRIFLRGQDITGLPPHKLAHLGIGRSYQVTNIFPGLSVLENVRLAAQAKGRDNYRLFTAVSRLPAYEKRAQEALERVGLLAASLLPALALPHGDKRKLELAILLAQNADIWLMDEPTAGLAAELVPGFMALVDEVRRDGRKTVLLVEHNMSIVMSLSDRITVMHQGQILAQGTPKEIANNSAVQQAYLGELFGEMEDTP
ncbi:MAG: ABC transporter ATP-binding protein [Candidatus Thermofonsia bacterium]|nr:MAG: ABC transporter ATP-binding protein [Candidatus Thermofonsia bacterium]